jgi:hypothetical protein
MIWLYVLSLLPLYAILRRNVDFGWKASYFILNWLLVSGSVIIASLVRARLIELDTSAEPNLAAVAFNLSLAVSLYVGAATYRRLKVIGVAARSGAYSELAERAAVIGLLLLTGAVALPSLLPMPPLFVGTPVAEFLASLNVVQRFAFVSLAISGLPAAQLARRAFMRGRISAATATLLSLSPALFWVLAGEKMGYLLFILFCSILPWLNTLRRTDHFKVILVLVGVAATTLTLVQYALNFEDPILQLGVRAALQGQLWYYFYVHAPISQPLGTALDVITGMGGRDTLRMLMEVAMPTRLFLEYDTATLTGSHLPALLYAFGWSLFPLALLASGFLFGVSCTMLRLAVQSGSPLLSYLIVACFVFPGVEVWVSGNTARLIQIPMTFAIFFFALLPMLFLRLRLRSRHQVHVELAGPSRPAVRFSRRRLRRWLAHGAGRARPARRLDPSHANG